MTIAANREYPPEPLPSGALGEFFTKVADIAEAQPATRPSMVRVVLNHPPDMSEFVAWPIKNLFAVSDLHQGHPGSVAIETGGIGTYMRVKVVAGYKTTALEVMADDPEVVTRVLRLGDVYLSGGAAAKQAAGIAASGQPGSEPEPDARTQRGMLPWLENHPAYRWIVVLTAIVGGIGLLVALMKWLIVRLLGG